MSLLDDELKQLLDDAAKHVTEELIVKRGFPKPWAEFKFTHEEFKIHKQYIEIKEGIPLVFYRPINAKDALNELTNGSYLLLIASVLAFGRRQTALVRCLLKRNETFALEIVAPVEVIETDYFPSEEVEKKKEGLVKLPDWIRILLHQIVGALIAESVRIALKWLLKLDP